MLMDQCARQARRNWIQYLCPGQIRRMQMVQKKHSVCCWYEWWRRFQNSLKILHLSQNWFYLTKGYLWVDLVTDCYFENSIKAAEKAQRHSATKIIKKSPKSKVPRDFSNFLSNEENKTRMNEVLFQAINEKKNAFAECSESTTDDLLTWTRVCVTEVSR